MDKREKGKLKIPEILSPAGTADAMKAAVNAGCDAVYMGGSLFSARAYAGNFDTEEMVSSIDHCHLFGVKTYMTVNTLLKENETGQLKEYMRPFYEAGLDGVIVQDMGVAGILKDEFPDLPLHASTQMSISSEYGARLMKRLGMKRIVPSRELSLEEIREIRERVDIETETFVHGAMCYAYSGKCLFSSFFGGRSGNRGRCAQPCRQRYTLYKAASCGPYIMSLKDMCTLSVLPQLIDAGIDSFKIEGRMKNPYYVAAVTHAYRYARDEYLKLLDAENTTWAGLKESSQREYMDMALELTDELKDIYNRGGFHTGYYFTEKGLQMTADSRPNHEGLRIGNVMKVRAPLVDIKLIRNVNTQDILEIRDTGIELTSNNEAVKGDILTLNGREFKKIKPGMEVLRTRNNTLLGDIEAKYIKTEKKKKGSAFVRARVGEPLQITVSEQPSGDSISCGFVPVRVTVTGNVVERAENAPVTAQKLISQMSKTGGTSLELDVSCEVDPDAFTAMSDLNHVRHDAMEKYRQAICSRYHR